MVMNNNNINGGGLGGGGDTNTKVVVVGGAANEKQRILIGIMWKFAGELKLILIALVFLCSLAIVLQFLPPQFSFSPPSYSYSSSSSCTTTTTTIIKDSSTSTISSNSSNGTAGAQPQDEVSDEEEVSDGGGVLKRRFNPYGVGAYNFILMSAYRGGNNSFAVIGLSSKPLHVFGKPTYRCQWINTNSTTVYAESDGWKILPDWGYGRIYTVVVINCTFPTTPIGADGGKLILQATTNDPSLNTTDTILALTETPKDYSNFLSQFTSPTPNYDYLYCGSSLYGNLSPQRVREWLAYHVRLFGPKSHFVIHDAGGVHEGVMEVLRPWIDKGFVTLQDIRDQEKFDGYYHNQFLIVNDCLHRYRFQAKWMWFFDVDEFIHVEKKTSINSVMDSLSDFTQFTFQQMTMSNKLCLPQDAPTAFRKWGFEKLVYRDVKKGIRRDRKYAVQPRNVFATGVHMSQNIKGRSTYKTEGLIKYFHYHGTISERREPCRQLVNNTGITVDGVPYVLDTTMRDIAGSVKRFEHKMIGSVLRRTSQ